MGIKVKTVIGINAKAKVISHARTDVDIRDLTVTIDEPLARGGTNLGASPTETIAVALAGCLSVVSHRIADSLQIDLKEMSIDVAAKFDRRGVMLVEEIDIPFPEMDVNIQITTNSASTDKVEQLKSDLHKFCPVSKMIRQSGTVLNENWDVTYV